MAAQQNNMKTAEKLIRKLKLKPLPKEGGYFIETYRSSENITAPKRYKGKRVLSTAIYYLLKPEVVSKMHRIKSDEVFHLYLGGPVEMLLLFPDSSSKIVVLGSNIMKGQRPQVLVPKNVWQGARLKKGAEFALLGTTVAPGFEYSDLELSDAGKLAAKYPKLKKMIRELV